MKFKSQVYTAVSGSIGGITYAHNAGGMYARGRGTPVNPNSTAQQAARNAVSSLVVRWTATVTQAQRDAWAMYAANVSVLDPFGDPRLISPLAMYIRCNAPRVRAGLAPVDAGPTTFTNAALSVISIDSITTGSVGTAEVDVAFNNADAWAGAVGGALLVQVGIPQSAGVNFFAGPFRLGGIVAGAAVPPTSPVSIASPFPIAAGQRLYIRARASAADGRLSAAQIANDVA